MMVSLKRKKRSNVPDRNEAKRKPTRQRGKEVLYLGKAKSLSSIYVLFPGSYFNESVTGI